jgi:hypothetical protein
MSRNQAKKSGDGFLYFKNQKTSKEKTIDAKVFIIAT